MYPSPSINIYQHIVLRKFLLVIFLLSFISLILIKSELIPVDTNTGYFKKLFVTVSSGAICRSPKRENGLMGRHTTPRSYHQVVVLLVVTYFRERAWYPDLENTGIQSVLRLFKSPVNIGKSHTFSNLWFPHLQSEDYNVCFLVFYKHKDY